jgi:outer membrane protein assembly factor BamB
MPGDAAPAWQPARWLPAILGGALLVALRLFAAGSRIHLPNTPAPPARDFVLMPPCSIDANADGVADVAMQVLERGLSFRVVGVDGRNGRELWRVSAADSDRMFCAGPDALVMVAKTGEARVLSPRDGTTRAALPPTGPIDLTSGAAGCFVAVGGDGHRSAFDSRGAPIGDCDAPDPQTDFSRRRRVFDLGVQFGPIRVFASQGSGAEPLVFTGHDGSGPRWHTALPIDASSGSLRIGLTRGGIVVAGHPVGNSGTMRVAYVSADGTMAYNILFPAEPARLTSYADVTIDPNERAIVHSVGVVLALDASTGTTLWTFGG